MSFCNLCNKHFKKAGYATSDRHTKSKAHLKALPQNEVKVAPDTIQEEQPNNYLNSEKVPETININMDSKAPELNLEIKQTQPIYKDEKIPENKLNKLITNIPEISLTEQFNPTKLDWILTHQGEVMRQMKAFNGWDSDYYNKYNPFTIYSNYHRKFGKNTIHYKQSNMGRLKSLGLQSMPRQWRHTISNEFYNDIDIVNAHPVILQFLCRLLNHPCPMLDTYVENRDEVLADISDDRDKAKTIILKLTNGGGGPGVSEFKNHFLDDYMEEMRGIHNKFAEMFPDEFKTHHTNIINSKPEYKWDNSKASYMNIWLCRVENTILLTIHKLLGSPNNAVLCFDGIMVDKSQSYDLRALEASVKNAIGIDIKLSVKPMLNVFNMVETEIDEIDDDDIKAELELLNSRFADDDFSDYFISQYPDFKYYNNECYIFRDNRWQRDNTNMVHRLIGAKLHKTVQQAIDKKYPSNRDYKEFERLSKCIGRMRNTSARNAILASILNYTTIKQDIFDLNPDLLGFDNGVYDLKEGKFRPARFDDYVSYSTGYDYVETNDTDRKFVMDFINKILPDEDTRDYLLEYLSTGLYGKQIQHFFLLEGTGANGKDVLMQFYKMVLGNDYYYTGHLSSLTTEKKSDLDVSMTNMGKKRFVIFNEPSRKTAILGSELKRLTGTTEVNARGCYSDQSIVSLANTTAMPCNGGPPIPGADKAVRRRVRMIPFKSTFTSREEIEEYIVQDNLYEADMYFDSDGFRDRYRIAFLHILLDYFKRFKDRGYKLGRIPAEVKEASRQYIDGSDDFMRWFNDNYEKTDDLKTYIKIKDVRKKYLGSNVYALSTNKDKRTDNAPTKFVERFTKGHLLKRFKKRHQPIIDGKRKQIINVLMGYVEIKIEPEHDDSDEESDYE